MGCWHAYAKLRLHTEHTLASFERITADLGTLLRHFSTVTCAAFRTVELPRERAARIRRTANTSGPAAPSVGSRVKGFNLTTYKLHALGDYPQTIRERGTTDNYTSQRVSRSMAVHWRTTVPLTPTVFPQVELEHRSSKAIYPRINKHDPERDIGRMHRRREVLQYLADSRSRTTTPMQNRLESGERYRMSEDSSDHVSLAAFTAVPRGAASDPAKKVRSHHHLTHIPAFKLAPRTLSSGSRITLHGGPLCLTQR
jgi:hypothetical protein